MGGGALLPAPPQGRLIGGHTHRSDVISTSLPISSYPPSRTEVEKAMADLKCFMEEISAARRELSLLEGLLSADHSLTVQYSGFRRLCDAFRLLQTEPLVQKMVLSIACDRAVWEAILNNPAVQDLQGDVLCAEPPVKEGEESPNSSEEKINGVSLIMKWIMDILELIQRTKSLVSLIFQQAENKGTSSSELSDLFEEKNQKVQSSFLLSIVLLFIVVVTRMHEM